MGSWIVKVKGHGNEADFPRFLHKSVRHRSLTQLHYISSRSDFGFEFVEIFAYDHLREFEAKIGKMSSLVAPIRFENLKSKLSLGLEQTKGSRVQSF